MKTITRLLLLMMLLLSTVLWAKLNTITDTQKRVVKSEIEKPVIDKTKFLQEKAALKITQKEVEAQIEVAPNAFYEIKEILSDADYDLQFEYPVGVGGGEAGIESDGMYFYGGATSTTVYEMDFDMMTILTMPVTGDIAGGLFMHPYIVSGFWTIGDLVQNVCLGYRNGYYHCVHQ